MTAFDHTASHFSENVFNTHDPILSPSTLHNTQPFGNNGGMRSNVNGNHRGNIPGGGNGTQEELLSPLLDLSEHDTCFDNTSQSLLNSNKVLLAHR